MGSKVGDISVSDKGCDLKEYVLTPGSTLSLLAALHASSFLFGFCFGFFFCGGGLYACVVPFHHSMEMTEIVYQNKPLLL